MSQPDIDGGQVLRAVSESLRRMIRHHIPELEPESAVVFDSPGEIESQDETKLSLYLYQTEINPYLRNSPPALTRRAATHLEGTALVVVPPPLVVDLIYLMVPYARSAELELVLVDKLIQLFHDVGAISGEWLSPVLKTSGNDAIQIVPEYDTSERLRNIWAGFPNKTYKLTKLYTVSPVRIPAAFAMRTDMITQTHSTYRDMP
ncbi:DUF4255 domain-containing protein [Trinickia fusca]|uniref:DUF4255 domain-containing protein n=1 Tax=Trinickia fusca TaxID=2419777 RepID=A0A494XFB7_9BURK|nr:DUF4255 domain-containing protein [Trinickia fusca]RKP46839.1 DUF4255 domain-containing protein [Trinickia fusca]